MYNLKKAQSVPCAGMLQQSPSRLVSPLFPAGESPGSTTGVSGAPSPATGVEPTLSAVPMNAPAKAAAPILDSKGVITLQTSHGDHIQLDHSEAASCDVFKERYMTLWCTMWSP
jgi:hypothetical protein